MGTAQALWITGPHQAELRDVVLPERGDDDVLVESLFSGVSRGTESLVWQGLVPPSEHDRMRCPHQAGEFGYPIKYGYCAVGRVTAGPGTGRVVFCLHPHQSAFVVPNAAVTRVPDGIPPARAVLAANMETAINAVWDAHVGPGDRVLVVGAGVVGCLVASVVSRIAGCSVQLADPDRRKASVANALGIPLCAPGQVTGDVDLAFDASASEAGLQLALDRVGPEGTVVEMSWFGARPVSLQLGSAFHARRLRILSSQVGMIPADRRARWDYRRRMDLAMRLLDDDRLDALVGGETDFEAAPDDLEAILGASAGTLCHRFRYRDV